MEQNILLKDDLLIYYLLDPKTPNGGAGLSLLAEFLNPSHPTGGCWVCKFPNCIVTVIAYSGTLTFYPSSKLLSRTF
jgi:hypothetical protein